MRRHVLISGVAVFAGVMSATSANADEHYRVTITGEVTSVYDATGSTGIQVGNGINITYAVGGVPDADPIPERGEYAMQSLSMRIGTFQPLMYPDSLLIFDIWYDEYAFLGYFWLEGEPAYMHFSLMDSTATVFSSDALPTSLDLSDFDFVGFRVEAVLGGLSVEGDIDSIDIEKLVAPGVGPPGAVPTISTWGLAILALMLLAGAKVYFSHRRAMQV